jgi:hypothetical protein
LTIAAPSASVEEPPNAAKARLTNKLVKLVDAAAQIMLPKRMSDETTKTGRLPKYSATGTQIKFLRMLANDSVGGGLTYTKTGYE